MLLYRQSQTFGPHSPDSIVYTSIDIQGLIDVTRQSLVGRVGH